MGRRDTTTIDLSSWDLTGDQFSLEEIIETIKKKHPKTQRSWYKFFSRIFLKKSE